MDAGPSFLLYALGIGGIAFAVGTLIGFVFRGSRVRRQVAPLETKISQLTAQLAATKRDDSAPSPEPKVPRWTGTEIAAIVAAAGTLVTGLGAFYVNYQTRTVKELEGQVKSLQEKASAAETQRAQIEKDTQSLLKADLTRWQRAARDESLIPTARPRPKRPFSVDNQTVSGRCDDPTGAPLAYDGYGPAVLRCSGKSLTIQLAKPTRLLLIADPQSGSQPK